MTFTIGTYVGLCGLVCMYTNCVWCFKVVSRSSSWSPQVVAYNCSLRAVSDHHMGLLSTGLIKSLWLPLNVACVIVCSANDAYTFLSCHQKFLNELTTVLVSSTVVSNM